MNEVHFIAHCDDYSCDLGSVMFDCPVCKTKNLRYDKVWWEGREKIDETGSYKLCCDECGEGLSITKEDYDYVIDHL
jgi:hypothetical protein